MALHERERKEQDVEEDRKNGKEMKTDREPGVESNGSFVTAHDSNRDSFVTGIWI